MVNCVEGSRFCWSMNPGVYPSLVKAYKKKYYSDSNLLTHTDTNCVGPRPLLSTLPPLNCGKATSWQQLRDRYGTFAHYLWPVSFNHPFGVLFQNFLQPHQIALSRRGGRQIQHLATFPVCRGKCPSNHGLLAKYGKMNPSKPINTNKRLCFHSASDCEY